MMADRMDRLEEQPAPEPLVQLLLTLASQVKEVGVRDIDSGGTSLPGDDALSMAHLPTSPPTLITDIINIGNVNLSSRANVSA